MIRETIQHTSREDWLADRRRDMTSTEISALFGCNPWYTAYRLWHYKAGLVDSLYDNEVDDVERVKWGRRLEPVIAAGVCEDFGWEFEPATEYMRIPSLRLGSSFDFRIRRADRQCRMEVKNVDRQAYREGWLVIYSEDDAASAPPQIEAPPHIELQLQQEMLCAGDNEIVLAALVGGNTGRVFERNADPEVHTAIVKAAAEFWKSIEAGQPPDPNFHADISTIRRLHPNIAGEPITLFESDRITALMREHKTLSLAARIAHEDAEARKAEIMHLLGDAPGANGPAGSLTRYPVAGGSVSYERKPRIDMRITHKKD